MNAMSYTFDDEQLQKYAGYAAWFKEDAGKASFELLEGSGRVMLSAPHSVPQWRNSRRKYGEYGTGALVRILHEACGCPVIYKTRNNNDDANYDANNPYKIALKAFIEQHNTGYLIDLHQLASSRPEKINIGIAGGRNVKAMPDMPGVITEMLNRYGITDISVDRPFGAYGRNTVSSYIARNCGIACVQMEINSGLLAEDNPDNRIKAIVAALMDVVRVLNGEMQS